MKLHATSVKSFTTKTAPGLGGPNAVFILPIIQIFYKQIETSKKLVSCQSLVQVLKYFFIGDPKLLGSEKQALDFHP